MPTTGTDTVERTVYSLVQDAGVIADAVGFVEELIDTDGLLKGNKVILDVTIHHPNDPTRGTTHTDPGVITGLSERLANMVAISRKYPDIQCEFNTDLNELLFMRDYLTTAHGRVESLVLNKDVYTAFVSFEHFVRFLSGLVAFFQPRMPRTGFRDHVEKFNTCVGSIAKFRKNIEGISQTLSDIILGIDEKIENISGIVERIECATKESKRISESDDANDTTLDKNIESPSDNTNAIDPVEELESSISELRLLITKFKDEFGKIKTILQAIEIMEIKEIIERYVHGHYKKDAMKKYEGDILLFDDNIRFFNEKKEKIINFIDQNDLVEYNYPSNSTEKQNTETLIESTNNEMEGIYEYIDEAMSSLRDVELVCANLDRDEKMDPYEWIGKIDMSRLATKMDEEKKLAVGLVSYQLRKDKKNGRFLMDSSKELLELFKVHVDEPTRANIANEEIRLVPYGEKAIPRSNNGVDRDIAMTRFMILVKECLAFCEKVRTEFFTVEGSGGVTNIITLTCQPTKERYQLIELMDCLEGILLISNRYFSHAVSDLSVKDSDTLEVTTAFNLFNDSRIGTRNKVWGLDTYAIKSRQVFRGVMEVHNSTYAAGVRSYIRNTSMILLTMLLICITVFICQFLTPSSVIEEVIVQTDRVRTVYFDKSSNVTAWRETIENRKSSCRPFNETFLECDITEKVPQISLWGIPIFIYASFAMVVGIISFVTAFSVSLLYTESLDNPGRMPRTKRIEAIEFLSGLNRGGMVTALVLQLASIVLGPIVYFVVLYCIPSVELYTRKEDGSMRLNMLYLLFSALPCFVILVVYFVIINRNNPSLLYLVRDKVKNLREKLPKWST